MGMKMLGLFVLAASIIIPVFGFVFGSFTRVRFIRIKLPEAKGFRIVTMSDLHISGDAISVAQAKRCIKLAMSYNPDVILLLGDIVSGRRGIPQINSVFSGINAPIYAVPGNHDYWTGIGDVAKALKEVGIKLLINDNVVLKKNDKKVAIVGIDDMWSGKPDWERAFWGITPSIPVILLSHNPDAALHPYHKRANLILSGHTHGGFWRMPFQIRQIFWKITGLKFIPATEYGWRFPHGLRKVNGTFVYVTSGVTKGYIIPRWFTQPEIVVVEFCK